MSQLTGFSTSACFKIVGHYHDTHEITHNRKKSCTNSTDFNAELHLYTAQLALHSQVTPSIETASLITISIICDLIQEIFIMKHRTEDLVIEVLLRKSHCQQQSKFRNKRVQENIFLSAWHIPITSRRFVTCTRARQVQEIVRQERARTYREGKMTSAPFEQIGASMQFDTLQA